MKRNIDLSQISDGQLYHSNSMVKLGCNDCVGCSACCHGMGESIMLDPYDIHQLTIATSLSFSQLLEQGYIELNIVDFVILPNLKMGTNETCAFLNEEGRCTIHAHRPGICRLFPLGRVYQNNSFSYFLQVHECKKENRTKVKISKWLGIDHLSRYETYINDWHDVIKTLGDELEANPDTEEIKKIQYMLLRLFYQMPYDTTQEFYPQFYERLRKII